jgi:hypothetical protein
MLTFIKPNSLLRSLLEKLTSELQRVRVDPLVSPQYLYCS